MLHSKAPFERTNIFGKFAFSQIHRIAFGLLAFLLLGASIEGAQFDLSWNDNSSNELGFCIERSSDGVHFKEIGITLANARSYADQNVTAGATYHYRVRAFNLFGYSNFSNTSSATIESAPSSPAPAPADDTAEPSTGGTAPKSSLIGPSSKPGGYTLDAATGLHLVSASGVGYESRDDALRFVHVQASGDVRFVARLRDYAPDADWSRTGLMIRQSLARNSRHASAVINGRGEFEALYRTKDGAALAAKRTTNAGSDPYLAIEKVGSTITMSGSKDGKSWSVISKVQIGFGTSFLIGLSIGSEFDGGLSSAKFQVIETKSFSFAGTSNTESDAGSGSDSGTAPKSTLIGPSSKAGEYALNSSTGLHFVSASGLGYETYDDALRFVHVSASGDVRFVVRLRDYAPDADWSRAGLMIRQSLARDSRHASALINGRGEFEALYRTNDGGGLGAKRTTKAGADPYLAIEKVGSTITMSGSKDGQSWSVISKVQIGFGSSFLIGLSIGSEFDGDLSAALFEVLTTKSFSFAGSGAGTDSDAKESAPASVSLTPSIIGPMTKSGQYSMDSATGVHLISASGVGYESRDDALRFSYIEAQGDRRFVIKMHDYNPDADWARAGVMIRQSLARNSRHASALVTGQGEFEALYRTKDGGALGAKRTTNAGATPYLAIEKTGSTITISGSKDGKTWNVISKPQISFGSTYLIGLSIGSEFDGQLSGAVMEVLQNN